MHKPKTDPARQLIDDDTFGVGLDELIASFDGELSQERLDGAVAMMDDPARASPAMSLPESRTRHTTIRIPADVLNAYRAEASRLGIGYQTLIVDVLRRHATTLNIPDRDCRARQCM